MAYKLREYQKTDLAAIFELLKASVLIGARTAYSQKEVDAWASWPESIKQLGQSLRAGSTVVAAEGQHILAIGQLAPIDYIQLLYTTPGQTRKGIATELYQELEIFAALLNVEQLYTHASRLSKPLFEKCGFLTIESQCVERHGVEIERFLMSKTLNNTANRSH